MENNNNLNGTSGKFETKGDFHTKYYNDLHEIEKSFFALDNTAYKTIEEANDCLTQYDKLKDDILSIIKQILKDFSISVAVKEQIYNKAVLMLANHIGDAVDTQKYGNILKSFHSEGKITEQQLNSFFNNLNIGRWQ
jgi:hypothetical protein